MTDISDQATHQEILWREASIKQASNGHPALPHGVCNSCGASCVGCFCDEDCRSQFEKERRMDKINGRG